MRIGTRILITIIFAVALSVTGVTVMISHELNKVFTNNFSISSKAQLDRMNAFVQIFFDTAISNIELLRDSPLVQANIEDITSYVDVGEITPVGADLPYPERHLYNMFQEIHAKFSAYSLVYLVSHKGGITQAPNDILSEGYFPSKRPWYLDVVRAGKTMITEIYVSDNGNVVCTVTAPVRIPTRSEYAGAVAIDINLETLNQEIGNVNVGKTGYMLMINDLGQIVSDPRNSGTNIPKEKHWLGKYIDDLPDNVAPVLNGLVASAANNTEVTHVEIDGKTWLARSEVTQGGFTLIMLQEQDEIFAEAMGITLNILLIGVAIFTLMVVISWLVSNSIAKPIIILTEAAHSVASGNLNAIPQNSNIFKGELKILHQSLQSMVTKLGELINTANEKMKEAEEALTLASSSLAEAENAKAHTELARRQGVLHTAGEISSAIEQLSISTNNLVDELKQTQELTEAQLSRVSHTSIAIGQMNIVIGEVANSSTRTALLAEQTSAETKQGKVLMRDVMSNMSKIQTQSIAMREGLEGLSVHAESIDVIMNVISDIADQTNLLALNAAIEAARAGDAGRGFAVVADEVRKLAEKTMEATKQVNIAITTIQDSTQKNMSDMQSATSFISDSTEVVSRTAEALEGIEIMVANTATEIRSIASASEEQVVTAVTINTSTQEMHKLMEDVALGTHRANKTVAELATLSQHLNTILEALRKR